MKRIAMTLVELLVVLAIIAILIGLFVAAVQKSSRGCEPVEMPEQSEATRAGPAQFPRLQRVVPPGYTVSGTDNLEMGGFSGFVPPLPHLEQDNLFRNWNLGGKWYEPPNAALVSVEVKLFYCPSNRSGGRMDFAFLVPIAGRSLPNAASCDYLLCKGANAAMCEHCQIPPAGRGAFDVNSHTRLDDITDGTSQTFAAGEGAGGNRRFGYRLYYQDTTAATGLFPGQSPYIDQSWSQGPAATQELHSRWADGRFMPRNHGCAGRSGRPVR